MSCYLQNGMNLSRDLYENVKSNYFLKGIQRLVDIFLDDSTKQVIRKYQSTVKAATSDKNPTITSKIQIKIIGIKLFLIYQKAIKTGTRIRDRLTQQFNLTVTSLGNAYEQLKSFVIVKKTAVCIKMVWDLNWNVIQAIMQKLRYLGNKVKYHHYTKKLYVFGNDIKELIRITLQVISECFFSTLKLRRTRALYNKVLAKYTTLKTNYKQIKQQSQILSYRIQSERGDQDVEIGDIVTKKISKIMMRNMKSEDNLYEKRKLSIKLNDGEILEEADDRSENLESKIQESSSEQTMQNIGSLGKIDSKISSPSLKPRSSESLQNLLSCQQITQTEIAISNQPEIPDVSDSSV